MKRYILLGIMFFITHVGYGSQNDDSTCRNIVIDFYKWYTGILNYDKPAGFQPEFAEDNNGFVCLDFTEYFNNLRKLKFTENLLLHEKDYYKTCMEHLKTIKYSDFKKQLTDFDLSYFENISCDFFNSKRWTQSMESFTGIEITKSIVEKNKAKIIGRIYETTPDKTYYYGEATFTLIKIGNDWFIDDIKI
jgi:hypothetical protein